MEDSQEGSVCKLQNILAVAGNVTVEKNIPQADYFEPKPKTPTHLVIQNAYGAGLFGHAGLETEPRIEIASRKSFLYFRCIHMRALRLSRRTFATNLASDFPPPR